jgi:hypothetical protein
VAPATVVPAADFTVIARLLVVMGRAKVAVTLVLATTLVASVAGTLVETVGGAESAVVNAHVFGAVIATPDRFFAVIEAVWDVASARAALGVRVALRVVASYDTVPATATPAPVFSVSWTLVGSIGWAKVAVTAVVVATFVARFVGIVDVTVGAVPSVVVKVQVFAVAIGVPDTLLALTEAV